MDPNPFSQRCSLLKRKVQSIESEVGECKQQLAWYSNFDQEGVAKAASAEERNAGLIRRRIDELNAQRASQAELEKDLRQSARLGLDPRRWFSEERLKFARLRNEARIRLKKLDKDIADRQSEEDNALQAAKSWHADLNRYRTTDPLALEAQRNALELQLGQLRPQLETLLDEQERVDQLLRGPLQRHHDLTAQLEGLERDLKQAQDLRRRLNEAADDTRARAIIHEECGDTFKGVANPTQVVHTKQRQIENVRKKLVKIELQINRIARLASRTISKLVIDGNALCFDGRQFVGLEPLLALSHALIGTYQVVVVFDTSIRPRLRMNDQQMARDFPQEAIVRVVPTRHDAEETMLETASGSNEYVISNDRFEGYADRPAVSGKRLIRHVIVAGKVLVHDLNLAVEYGMPA